MAKRLAVLAFAASASLVACSGGEGPPAPYGVVVTSVNGAADVRWGYGSTSDLGCFLIQRSEGGNYNFVDFAKASPRQFYFHDDAVAFGEWYYYRVAAFYKEWNGEKAVLSKFSAEAGCQVE